MRRFLPLLTLLLGVTLLAAEPASAAVAAQAENRASGSVTYPGHRISTKARLSAEAIRKNAALAYDFASDSPVAARGGLKNGSGSIDDAANAARTQPHRPDTVSTHAQGRMESRGISYGSVQEAIRNGTRTFDPATGKAVYDLPASASSTGRAVRVIRNDVTGNIVSVIDRGSR